MREAIIECTRCGQDVWVAIDDHPCGGEYILDVETGCENPMNPRYPYHNPEKIEGLT